MANYREFIEINSSIDSGTVEVVRELEEHNHDFFPLAKDRTHEFWVVQKAALTLPDRGVERMSIADFMQAQLLSLTDQSRWFLGPAYEIVFPKDQRPTTVRLEDRIGLWDKLRKVKPVDKGVWDYITWRRLSTETNLLGQYQVGDQGSISTMVRDNPSLVASR